MSPVPRRRLSGLLLHPTSFPSPHGIGDLGEEAHRFLDFLEEAGQHLWQMLPVNPTGLGYSPYSATSAFAGNPLLIDLRELIERGELDPTDPPPPRLDGDRTDYAAAEAIKRPLLQRAARRFLHEAGGDDRRDFDRFCSEQSCWLDDFCLFQALRDELDAGWQGWPHDLRCREPKALARARKRLAEAIDGLRYQQFTFDRQWHRLKAAASARGIELVGDIPIFVAEDSADVWSHPQLFRLDAEGRPTHVAGCPPDYFSATGQRWGNPQYDWDALAAEGYRWWLERFRANLRLFDRVRVDHFRGFEAAWSIPADEDTAVNGRWETVPGADLFDTLLHELGPLPLIAEDLGVITPEVEALRDRYDFPGMKILQFAFDSGPDNPYLPHNLVHNSVAYTGTHDNDTSLGWWRSIAPEQQQAVQEYLGCSGDDMPWPLIRTVLASIADIAVIPLQDALELNGEARMNRPGTSRGNWDWRLRADALTAERATRLRTMSQRYGRNG